jgi:hypothetical protein
MRAARQTPMKARLAPAFALACASGLAAQQRLSLAGTWELAVEADGAASAFDRRIEVPGPFETALGTSFDGVARYRRTLPLPKERVARVRIEFAAVATHATVFCNGKQVGEHLGGWTPFRVDVTEALQWNGNDVLEVRVDEKVGHNTQGFLPIIQPHFGGIWQDVTLCLDGSPVLDRLSLFVFGDAAGELSFRVPVLAAGADPAQLTVGLDVFDGERLLATARLRTTAGGKGAVTGSLRVENPRTWAPGRPELHTVRLRLLDGDTELDHLERRIGFRTLAADGTRVLWNSSPLQVRGILHWGYSPPHLAPPTDPAYWRRQLTDFKSLGFNCIKCCLWVPPTCVYELADELGLCVWQEYPTWHPQMDQAHKQELLTEYGEFFVHDRSHASVAFRSITCETGQGADLDVVKSLYDACKAAVPQTLVVDDSSWIGWQRITDFWDEHPYGNNSWFPGRLEDFRKHIAEKGKKPLLLGECIAADTWADRAQWNATHGTDATWWRPDCWPAQGPAEEWLTREFGADTLRSLRPISLDFGLQNRKFQIEQLHLGIPDAGYVVSVARDFAKARMGLYDDFDRLKWTPEQWRWHGDTMLCLDLPWNGRCVGPSTPDVPIRVSHYGVGPLQGTLRLWTDAIERAEVQAPVVLQPGEVSAPFVLSLGRQHDRLSRVRVHAELTGSHPSTNHWDLWTVPAWHSMGMPPVVTSLSPELLTEIENGRTVMLAASDRKGSLRTEPMWFLKGAPFAPPHPVHERVPRDLLLELASFDLETGRVMPWDLLKDQVDPILAFWETHDIAEVRFHLLAFDCRIGKGRLLATTLNLDAPPHGLGSLVRYLLQQHLASGPAPKRELSAATVAALRASLTERRIDLPTWRFRMDPKDEGRAANWHDPKTDVTTADWRDLRAGSHWENQGEDLKHFTGVAWYRIDLEVPADWQGLDARAVFDGVDDSFELWLNGEPAGSFGDPVKKVTIWLERQVAELGQRLRPGSRNTLVLRVVDHAGAGGLWKPAFLTTGPADARSKLLH